MKQFARRAVQKIEKLSSEQVSRIFASITEENDAFDAVLESLNIGLLVCNLAGEVLLSNKAAERLCLLQTERTNEQFVWDLMRDKAIASFLKIVFQKQKSNCSEEFTIETLSGTSRIVIVSVLPFVKGKKIAGSIIQIDDVTERRSQQTLLRRMESLASLTNLAASVAHEIKNPLGAISIHIQLMQRTLAKARQSDGMLPSEKYAEHYLDIINEEIERLNKIVVDFLFAVRPISAKLESANPDEVVASLAEFLSPELEKENVSVQVSLMQKTPSIMIDVQLFKQVVLNIMQNATSAMSEDEKNTQKKLYIQSLCKDDAYVLNIADNGTGMDESTKSRVFEPYFTTKANGTGLGLTMAYKIIKEFGGDIQVHSKLSEGTIFTITLPIPQKERWLLEERV